MSNSEQAKILPQHSPGNMQSLYTRTGTAYQQMPGLLPPHLYHPIILSSHQWHSTHHNNLSTWQCSIKYSTK